MWIFSYTKTKLTENNKITIDVFNQTEMKRATQPETQWEQEVHQPKCLRFPRAGILRPMAEY